MELTNYAGGARLELPQDAQIVKGVSGNGFYLPYGYATQALNENCAELTLSIWRKWDSQADDEDRGVFKLKNLEAKFDKDTDKLTVLVNGVIFPIDNKDDTEFNHWCFIYKKLDKFKVYKNGKSIFECPAPNVDVDFSEGVIIGGGKTHATFDEFRIYVEAIKENEVAGLHQLVSKGTQVHHVEHLVNEQVALHSPKYLGTTKHLPELQKVIIEKGAKAGVNQASIGDWFLMIETIQNFEKGYCYRWTGKTWQKLDPPEMYTEEYQAGLLHIFEVPELMQGTGHYGALFCKMLVAQKAMIDELVANQAFIESLVVQKLKIDSDVNSNSDFEVAINKNVGILAKNKDKKVFEVNPRGDIYAKDAVFQNCLFQGDIVSGPLELLSQEVLSTEFLIKTTTDMKDLYDKFGVGSFFVSSTGITNIFKISISNSLLSSHKQYYSNGSLLCIYTINLITVVFYKKNTNITLKQAYISSYFSFPNPGNYGVEPEHNPGKTYSQHIAKETIIKTRSGAKIFKLNHLPTMKPKDSNVVWVNKDGFLQLS